MHLFAGGGGGMYADLILGHEPTVAVEIDKYACGVLERQKKNGWWPKCEIIEKDITSFSGKRYAGKVDCIHAGFPCQDLSIANNERTGLGGDRSGLYREAIRIFCEIRPRYMFFENVPGILTANGGESFNRLLSDLAHIGFNSIRWKCLRATEVGCNMEGERFFLLASTHRIRSTIGEKNQMCCEKWGDLHDEKRECQEKEQRWKELFFGCAGCGWWESEPSIKRMDNGLAEERDKRLRMVGNGIHPLQAAMAWIQLGGPHNAF